MKVTRYILALTLFAFLTEAANSQCMVLVAATPDTICKGASSQLDAMVTPSLNYLVEQIAFNPDTSIGTQVFLGEDEVSDSLPIGFTFKFYDHDYTSFHISSNGFITFDSMSAEGCCSGQLLPNSFVPNNLIAFAWEDYSPQYGGKISYLTKGIAPNRKLIVRFDSLPHYYNYNGVDPVTSQIVLYETSNVIEIHTLSMPGNVSGNWLFHTEGIENAGGTTGIAVPGRNATNNWTAYNDAWRFTPQHYSFNWSPIASLSDAAISNPVATPDSSTEYTVTVSDSSSQCAATASITVYVETCTTIYEEYSDPSFRIFPNPASDEIFISRNFTSDRLTVDLVNVNGKKIIHEEFGPADISSLRISDISPGVYFVRIVDESSVNALKVLVSK